jgi:hypothetical protein
MTKNPEIEEIEEEVRAAGQRWRQAEDEVEKARAHRDDVIRRAVTQGVSKYRAAQLAGVTRVRVAAIIAKPPTDETTREEET